MCIPGIILITLSISTTLLTHGFCCCLKADSWRKRVSELLRRVWSAGLEVGAEDADTQEVMGEQSLDTFSEKDSHGTKFQLQPNGNETGLAIHLHAIATQKQSLYVR